MKSSSAIDALLGLSGGSPFSALHSFQQAKRIRWTDEQEAVFQKAHDGIWKINAVAGAGKTSTLFEWARRQGSAKKILYLVNARDLKDAAAKESQSIKSMTWHGYALSKVPQFKSCIKTDRIGFDAGNPGIAWDDNPVSAKMGRLALFNFCQDVGGESIEAWVEKQKGFGVWEEWSSGSHSSTFEKTFLKVWEYWTSGKANSVPWALIFKLASQKPHKHFDALLLDEAQDMTPTMLKMATNIRFDTMISVGDPGQQIWEFEEKPVSWQAIPGESLDLSASLRVGPAIAEFVNPIREKMGLKRMIGAGKDVPINRCNIPHPDDVVLCVDRKQGMAKAKKLALQAHWDQEEIDPSVATAAKVWISGGSALGLRFKDEGAMLEWCQNNPDHPWAGSVQQVVAHASASGAPAQRFETIHGAKGKTFKSAWIDLDAVWKCPYKALREKQKMAYVALTRSACLTIETNTLRPEQITEEDDGF